MGLFDRFKKRVKEVAEEVDSDALTAVEDSEEAVAALESHTPIEEDWEEDVPDAKEEPIEETMVEPSDDDWDDWEDEDDEITLPVTLSKKERKRLEKLEKEREKELKRRKATTVAKPKGSKVDLLLSKAAESSNQEKF
jgi:hypothetical protein